MIKLPFAELTTTFHCVKHNISYNCIDCNNKLLPQLFTDSNIAKKISCGKTKCESIVKKVLGPLAEEVAMDSLKTSTLEKNNYLYFSSAKQHYTAQHTHTCFDIHLPIYNSDEG